MSKLAAALVAFQAECPVVPFDSLNPHFKSRYASLAAIHRVIAPLLAKHGLAVMQFPASGDGTAGCITRVMHASGESIEHVFLVPLTKLDPQGACSAVTYARRYGLSGALGLVTDEDDDGEAAQGRAAAVARPNSQPKPREAKATPAMAPANREKLKFAARQRMKELTDDSGTAVDMMRILQSVAEGIGVSSPVQMTDAHYPAALEAVQKWEPAK